MRFSEFPFSGFFVSLFLCLIAVSAQAITIDEFESASSGSTVARVGDQFSTSSYGANIPADATGRSTVIGSNRKYTITSVQGYTDFAESKVATGLGRLRHSQDIDAKAISTVIWDGTASGLLNPEGLGGIDFTQDASSAIVIDIERFDLPFGMSVELDVVIYTSANAYSKATIILDTPIFEPATTIPTSDWTAPNKVIIPFSSFQTIGSLPVDFESVGAIKLNINGLIDAVDLKIEKIGTDSCPYVPDANNQVVDECGVCNGDNTSCADCLGVPNGTSLPGVACDNNEMGVCDGGTFSNTCSCERNEEPTTELCDGLDNNCDGAIDESFPSLDTTCGIGDGLCEFTGKIICSDDMLGVKCDDADALQDLADQCEEDKGCDDIPNSGLVFDDCGVCGGDNSSCTDCKGVLNGTATKDRCGICNGDGQSCLNCDTFDQSALLNGIDGGSLAQERLINKFNRNLKQLDNSPKALRFIKRTNAEASKLQVANWGITWSLPVNVTTCGNTKFCIATSNQDRIGNYQLGSEALRKLGQKVIRRVQKAGANEQSIIRMEKANNRQHTQNVDLTSQVPVVQSVCSK